MNDVKRIAIVGATSAIAEQCARLWLRDQSVDLTLIGRDTNRIERVAADLKVRSPQSDIHVLHGEFLDPIAIQKSVDEIAGRGPVDIVLVAQGFLPEQGVCQIDLQACSEALAVNGMSPVLYAEAFAKHMALSDGGTIALIGSVAGERGRKSNYVYGAAKGLVARYAQGLQHRFANTGIRIVLIKPGPTDTPMTASLKQRGVKLASVETVAAQIIDGVETGKAVIYAPRKWCLIMMLIRHLPSFLFNKMEI